MSTIVAEPQAGWTPFGIASEVTTRRVLVLDEAPSARRTLLAILGRSGVPDCDIAVAEGEADASHLFDVAKPTVVFLELEDVGAQAVERMLAARPDVRVILVTSAPRDGAEVRRAMRAGAFALIEKPLRGDRVRQVLQEMDREDGGVTRLR